MQKIAQLEPRFVQAIPDDVDSGILYVSTAYKTMIHRCCCGCRSEIVTPLSATDWNFTFDGDSISVSPSIGNWRYPCRSHYVIHRGHVVWAEAWSPERIAEGRAADREAKIGRSSSSGTPLVPRKKKKPRESEVGFWERIFGPKRTK